MAIGTILTAVSLLKDLAPGIGKVAEKFLDGKASREELQAEADKHELSAEVRLALAQIQLNTAEASHSSLFVAGWRPFIGWTGGIVIAFNYIVFPFATAFGLDLPVLDLNTMMPVILGMLGIGGMRTYERMGQMARNNMLEKF